MDWLGGGDTVVRNAFLRASDDVFAMQGNWDGYKDEDMVRPGHDVQNITDRAQRAVDEHFEYRARGMAAEDLQLARLYAARLGHSCTAASAHADRRLGLLGFWGAKGAQGRPLQITLLRICFWTTGTRWCNWSRRSRALHGVQLPQHLGAGPAAAGRFDDDGRCGGRDF